MSHKITRRRLLAGAGASAAFVSAPAIASPLFRRGGHPHGAGATLLHTFGMQEVNGAASRGLFQVGLPLPPNSVMPGETLEARRADGVTVVPAQFDLWSSYRLTNEGLGYVVMAVADGTNFTASETRTYTVYKKSGSFSNTAATTLAAALVGHDYNVYFTNITGAVSGALSDITVNLATLAAVASRVTQYQSGPYKNSWEIWGETSHAHLIVTFYYSQIRDASGTVVSDELTVEPGMFWWDVGGKETLTYDAELRDGLTVIATYTGVVHNPHACWAMVRTQNDNQHALPPWSGAAIPSLLYIPDKQAWKDSGKIPRYDLSITSTYAIVNSTYIPGRALDHRYAPSGTGAWMAEGLHPNSDLNMFQATTAANVRKARVNGLVGLHYAGNHCRTAEVVTKPGKAADKANMLCPQMMWHEAGAATPSSYYDFSVDGLGNPTGMPVPKRYYRKTSFSTSGWIVPPAGSYTQPDGVWEESIDTSHYPNYSQFSYLYYGHRHFLKQVISDCVHQVEQTGTTTPTGGNVYMTFWNGDFSPPEAVYPGAASTRWLGVIPTGKYPGVTRMTPRALQNTAAGLVIPDNEIEAPYIDQHFLHQVRFMKANLDLIPASGNGMWSVPLKLSGFNGAQANFMYVYFVLMTYYAYSLSRDARMKTLAEYLARYAISFGQSNRMGMASATHVECIKDMSSYPDEITNPFFTLNEGFMEVLERQVINGDTATNGLSSPFGFTDGDIIIFPIQNVNGVTQTFPAEITPMQTYYAVSTTATTFKFAATVGGTPIVTTGGSITRDVLVSKQANSDPTKWIGVKNATDYGLEIWAAIKAARQYGHPLATTTVRDRIAAMYGAHPMGPNPWFLYEAV